MSENIFATTIERLSDSLTSIYSAQLGCYKKVALLDFPNHPNIGDSAIWQGEIVLLKKLGVEVIYSADLGSFSDSALSRTRGLDAILLHGGGNLGNLYPHHQAFRERILKNYPQFPIIQLAQTKYFSDADASTRFFDIVNKHPNVTLFARDETSFQNIAKKVKHTVILCPDAAFAIGDQSASRGSAGIDFVLLTRSDAESRVGRLNPAQILGHTDLEAIDWPKEPVVTSLGRHFYPKIFKRLPLQYSWISKFASTSFNSLANSSVNRGYATLSIGRGVITDRLHSHILCLLLGIPHITVDSGYGKITQFVKTWQTESEGSILTDPDNIKSAILKINNFL